MVQSSSPSIKHWRYTRDNICEIKLIQEIVVEEREELMNLLCYCLNPIDIYYCNTESQIDFHLIHSMFLHSSHLHGPSSFVGILRNGIIFHLSLESLSDVICLKYLNAFTSLYQIDLNLNEVKQIPNCFQTNMNTKVINIKGKSLTSLPSSIANFRNVSHFSVDSLLTEMPAFFYCWIKIIHITIDSKSFQTLPWLLALRKEDTFNIFEDLKEYYLKKNHLDFNQLKGESRSIFDAILEELKPKYENMEFNGPLIRRIRQELIKLYPERYHIIVEKIKNNTRLDPLDWTHPEFVRWGASFEKVGEEYPTTTFHTIQQRLMEQRAIQGDNGWQISL